MIDENLAAKIENEKLAAERLTRVLRLLANPDFQWFINGAVLEEQANLDAVLHSRQKTSIERDMALERWHALESVRTWATEARDGAAATLGHAPIKSP